MESALHWVAIFLGLVGYCTAIRCYDCSYAAARTDYNPNCGKDFNAANITISECSGTCQKYVQNPDSDTSIVIYRTCASVCVEGDADGQETTCCDSDLCNSAVPSTCNSILIVFMTVVVSGWRLVKAFKN